MSLVDPQMLKTRRNVAQWYVDEHDGDEIAPVSLFNAKREVAYIDEINRLKSESAAWDAERKALVERCERAEGALKRAVKVCEDAVPWVAIMTSDHDTHRHPQSIENAKNDLAALINFVNEIKPGTFRPQGAAQ